jgi:3-(3-hydroxy-phenyl)propionate hydroxylase
VPSQDVIVVGAGPVGLVTAYGLARRGVSVTVLEAEDDVVDSPRAMVYHWALLEDLERLDLLAEIDRRGFRKDDYGYRVHTTGEMLTYTLDSLADETPFPYNIHLGQDALCTIVLERLNTFPHATVRWGTPVTALEQDAGGVRVTARTSEGEEQHDAAWLIGSDGARSTVRGLLAVPFEGMTWAQRFVATNVFYDFAAHGYTRSVFLMDDVHGAVIAKITDQDLWRVTYSEPLTEPEERIGARLPAQYAAILPDDRAYEVERYAPYRLHQRAAERFRVGRVLLAGDAAHATNPTGGFGLASGLCGAFALIDPLASVAAHGADPACLDQWADERRRIFLEIASPAATRMKQTVYDADASAGHETIEALRRMIADPAALRERLMFPTKLRSSTPALSQP